MKILVIGTGVIGTLYAIALSKHNQIYHYVRKHKLNEWNKKTINYDILDERQPRNNRNTFGTYAFQCVDKITEPYDLIIIPVNSYQLIEILKEINGQAQSANYLLMTLNWKGTSDIDHIISLEQYILGYASGGGTYKDNNTVLWGNVGSDLLLGSVNKVQNNLLQKVTSMLLESEIKPEIPFNILHALWLHNISTAPFGIALTKHKNVKKTVGDKELVRVCFGAMRECYQICSKRGVSLKEFPETKMYSLPFFILYPLFKKNLNGEIAQRYTAHALLALDEMKCNFYEMLETGRSLNIKMPNMEILHHLIS